MNLIGTLVAIDGETRCAPNCDGSTEARMNGTRMGSARIQSLWLKPMGMRAW
jgi:hypothetical protein